MHTSSKLFVNNTHKTKPWWIFLSVLVFVFIGFLIVWLLCGEINLLGLNWIVPKNKSVWHGQITESNIDFLSDKYALFYEGGKEALHSALSGSIGKSITINSYQMFFNPLILSILFSLLVLSFAYPIILNIFKISGLDILPFSFSIGIGMFTLIITGLIPIWTDYSKTAFCWIVKLIIAFVVGISFFFITNYSVNSYLARKGYSYDITIGYKTLDNEVKPIRDELKTNLDAFKNKKNQDKSYIDLPQENK